MPPILPPQPALSTIAWTEGDQTRQAGWPEHVLGAPPKRIQIVDDTVSADAAFRFATQGTSMLWRGDFQNARQLLQALGRRLDQRKNAGGKRDKGKALSPTEQFHRHRLQQAQRADLLNRVLVELDVEMRVDLPRAPDVQAAVQAALGDVSGPLLVSLRALQGFIGAFEWRKKGVEVAGLPKPLHIHYGVFSPVRGEYVDLVAKAPLPSLDLAFDVGTGSGVLAAVLAQRGIRRIIATDMDMPALACAHENIQRLGLGERVVLQQGDLFPEGLAPLIVCNPPWLPAKPTTAIEHALYDPDSRMLRGFLQGAASHLTAGGEAWLILSDLAEHLGLRTREFLLQAIADGGLRVLDRLDAKPRHAKASDASDPLHMARRAEVTSLWRLGR